MARDVDVNIVAHDKTRGATDSAGRNFDKLNKKVQSVGTEGGSMGDRIKRTFASSLSSLPGVLAGAVTSAGTAGIVAAVAVGPLIGAALVAGILLGLAGGVLAVGIITALRDPGVKTAASELGTTIKTTLTNATKSFIGPMKQAFGLVQTAIAGNADEIKKMFDTIAPVIVPLTRAFIQLAINALPGIQKGLEAAVPIILKIAEKAPAMGTAISRFFTIVAQYGPMAADLIGKIMDAISFLLPWIARLIGWITSFYSTAIRVWGSVFRLIRTGVSNTIASFNAFRAAIGRVLGQFNALRAGVQSRISAVLGIIRSLPGRIRSALGSLGGILVGAGRALVQGLINGINAMLGRVRAAVSSIKNAVSGIGSAIGGLFSGNDGGFQMAFAGGPSSFAAGEGRGRTEAPRQPITVDSRVYLGNELLDARVRTIVGNELDRQAYRARVGRR